MYRSISEKISYRRTGNRAVYQVPGPSGFPGITGTGLSITVPAGGLSVTGTGLPITPTTDGLPVSCTGLSVRTFPGTSDVLEPPVANNSSTAGGPDTSCSVPVQREWTLAVVNNFGFLRG